MAPFIMFGGKLWAFQRLTTKGNPFSPLVGTKRVEKVASEDWWDDPDLSRWFSYLLNNSLNKLTGRKRLGFDRQHRRYYFRPKVIGKPLSISYRPMNQSRTSRDVVWNPVRKKDGQPRDYWIHRAVALRFHRAGQRAWFLSIRPELRVTKDGEVPLDSDLIGRRVTRRLARQFNDQLLGEIQFWRDYLSDSSPRILFPFGEQLMEVSTDLMSGEITWPGIPEEHARSFANVSYDDNLFSWARLRRAMDFGYDDETDDDEEGS